MTAKKASEQPASTNGPKVGRPRIPAVYGFPKHNKGLLPWSHVSERMEQARSYWVCTVSPDSHPHATPVDGVWLDDTLYFGGDPATRRHRNLNANPLACIHLESASDVIILHGVVRKAGGMDHALAVRLADASNAKYGYGATAEGYKKENSGTFAFRIRVALAWKHIGKDPTRWEFPAES